MHDHLLDARKSGLNPRVLILCDFDGTVSTKDTVNRLVRDHLTDPEWRFQVKRYLRGEVGSREVYQAVAPMMRMTPADLENFVQEHAALDPGFPSFLSWARGQGIDVKIVSDGFDATIRTLLNFHEIHGLEIFANTLTLADDGSVAIGHPYYNPDCGTCGTCKRDVLRRFRTSYDRIVLIGDGESDRHAASEADEVVALDALFVYCAKEGIPAIRTDGFSEVPSLLGRRIKAVMFDMDGTLIDSHDVIVEAFNHMFARLGYPLMTADEVVRNTGISLVDFTALFLKPEERETGIKVFRDYLDGIYLPRLKMVPGALETLESLDGDLIQGIVTNKKGIYARRIADHLGISDRMALVLGAEDGFRAKPSGEMFQEFMRSVGSDKHTTVYVGDAPVDIEAAAGAGIDAFAVAGRYFSAEELALHKPRRVLQSITQLPAALRPVV